MTFKLHSSDNTIHKILTWLVTSQGRISNIDLIDLELKQVTIFQAAEDLRKLGLLGSLMTLKTEKRRDGTTYQEWVPTQANFVLGQQSIAYFCAEHTANVAATLENAAWRDRIVETKHGGYINGTKALRKAATEAVSGKTIWAEVINVARKKVG